MDHSPALLDMALQRFWGALQGALQTEQSPMSPLSTALSTSASVYNPNSGLQLCTSVCEFTELLWPTLLAEEHIALQSSCCFINRDLTWYIRDLSAVVAPQSTASEEVESEDPQRTTIAGVVCSALPRIAG